MRRTAITWHAFVVLGLLTLLLGAAATGYARNTLTYHDYAEVLKTHVNDDGLVNYKGLLASKDRLDAFLSALATLNPARYDQWSERDKIAFWINAYNALTLHAIVENYPIKPSFFASLRYPKNSIRQIPGVWDTLRFGVMGRQLTLDEIEHEILRKQFREPRVHVALVCAAMGCPSLRNEPYVGDLLDVQFNDQAHRFLESMMQFHINLGKKRVYLSSIFKWFGEDFVPIFGTDERFSGHSQPERATLNFLSSFLPERARDYLLNNSYNIAYLDYDWSLNEQKGA